MLTENGTDKILDEIEKRLPTADDIRKLALHEPIINICLTLSEINKLTEEQALMLMVIHYCRINRDLTKRLIDNEMNRKL